MLYIRKEYSYYVRWTAEYISPRNLLSRASERASSKVLKSHREILTILLFHYSYNRLPLKQTRYATLSTTHISQETNIVESLDFLFKCECQWSVKLLKTSHNIL